MTETTIRPGRAQDLPALVEIYNHYVRHTPITFDVEPYTVAQRRPWLESFADTGRYRLLVAERDGAVVGYSCTHRFRVKAAYDTSVESSVYLAPVAAGSGLGSALYTALFDLVRDEDIHLVMAGITLPNDASIALHRRFGFESCGVMREVGRKFDRYWSVEWLQKRL